MGYSRQYQNWHSDSNEYFAKIVRSRKNQISQFLKDAPLDARILEIGCGMGFTLAALIELGYRHVLGVDSDSGQIEKCQSRKLPAIHVDENGEWIKEQKQNFDYIIALDVLEHIPKIALIAFCKELHNILNTNGKLLGTVPNAHSSFAATYRWDDWTHHSSFTPTSIDYVLWHAGFQSIVTSESETIPRYRFIPRTTTILWWMKKLMRQPRRLSAILEMGSYGKGIPLSLNLFFTATK